MIRSSFKSAFYKGNFLLDSSLTIYDLLEKESTILKQLSGGSQQAFRSLYDLHGAAIYQLAFHILKDEKRAEEIVQDTFLLLWDNRSKILIEKNVKTYLYVICRNASFNKLKQYKREQQLFTPFSNEHRDSEIFQQDDSAVLELTEVIDQILSKLPDRQQLIFRMCRLEGLSHKEIAEQLAISIQTVKNQMVSAQRFVTDELHRYRNDHNKFLFLFFLLFF